MKKYFLLCIAITIATVQLKAQVFGDLTCYTIAHNNGNANVLFQFSGATSQWTEIGFTGTNNITAIATDQINNIIYAIDGGTFGKINLSTGTFNPIGVIGQASGDFGTIELNNIKGATFDPANEILYATHSIESGELCNPIINSNDLLFQIDVNTGQFINGAMLNSSGSPVDYALIPPSFKSTIGGCANEVLYDVNDIAFNPYTGELHAIQSQKIFGEISIINPVNASIEYVTYDLQNMDLIGLTFSALGNLFGTTGNNALNKPANCFKYIDLQNQQTVNLPFPDPSGNNFDFSALGCLAAYNDLALKLIVDPNTAMPISLGGAVTFLVEIYNQGELDNTDIYISNYIPNGLVLNDPLWTLIPGTNIAEYNFTNQLAKGDNITIPINFTVDANFTGSTIINSAEITASYNTNITDINGNPLPLVDIDSTPNDTNDEVTNGSIIVDDNINGGGPNLNEDEDDHDIATIIFEEKPDLSNAKSYPCYTVNEDNGADPNMLFQFDPIAQKWTILGEIDPIGDLIEAIATDPINNIIYAYDAGTDVLGIIDPNAVNNPTLFTPIDAGIVGLGVGTGNGDYGPVALNDVDGLTFDPVNMILYGTHRIKSGSLCNPITNSNDLFFQIDIATGQFVPGAMLDANEKPADYAIIEKAEDSTAVNACNTGNGFVYDVDDIAYNPYSGELYAISNQDGPSLITSINPLNGRIESVIFDLNEDDVEGLGFSYLGKLYGTKGDTGATIDQNEFFHIDIENQAETLLPFADPTGTFVDYEAFDCFTAFNDLALSYTFAPGNPFSLTAGTTVTFLANVYNQGAFTNTDITITNYLSNGLILNDADWTANNSGKATYTITEELKPGDAITVPITFIIETGFEGQTITGAAEISSSFSIDLVDVKGNIFVEPLPDVDSTPDDVNNEIAIGVILVDNKTNGSGPYAIPQEDEDDHDIASIAIPEVIENLSLLIIVTPALCNSLGATEIKILGNSTPPYTHKWLGPLGSLVHSSTNNNVTHQVTGLPAGIYYAIVTDTAGKISSFVVTVLALAANSGNLNCNDNCPDYLTTPDNLLFGTFQAEEIIEIKGFVDGSQNTEFRICD